MKKIVDKETGIEIPENKINRDVVARLKGCSVAELHLDRKLIAALAECEKLSGDACEPGFNANITLRFIDNEIALRDKGVVVRE